MPAQRSQLWRSMAGLARTYKPDAEVNDHVSLGQKIVFTISSACQSLRHDCVDALLHKLPLHDNNILLSAHMPCSCAVPFAEHFFWRRFHALFMHLCAVPLAEHFFWRRSHALFMHSCAVPFAEHFFWRRRHAAQHPQLSCLHWKVRHTHLVCVRVCVFVWRFGCGWVS